MKATPEIYLDIPLVPTDDDGAPGIRLRLECAEIAKVGRVFMANLYEDGKVMLSARLGYTDQMFIWAYMHHVLHRIALNVHAYNAKGDTDFSFYAWCDGGALFVGWGWRVPAGSIIGRARLDESGLAGLRRMAQDMIETDL